ncbi:MAG: SpvB/TcaC N-terminal domain-containing protein, partial [Candidatus Binatia bacterium]
MTRSRKAAGLVAVFAAGMMLIPAGTTRAQSIPGHAPGSQTGDTGGAYTGLASSPEANLFTGVAQTSIPIEVPPGRLGLAPVLALAYSSNAGASAYGHGWTLALPRIHRSTKRGVPRYDDTDTYVLEMPGSIVELEPVPGSVGNYRAEIESAFLRIAFNAGDNHWRVIDKLGVTFDFGLVAATRTGRGAARNDTFAWLLQRIEDPAGNHVEFSYRAGGAGGTSRGLPELIRYGGNRRTAIGHFAEVAFTWTALTHAAPARISWREGFADALDVRLAAVDTRTQGLAARRYDFSHEEDAVTSDLRLVGATLTAFGESAADDVVLPSTVFVYAPALHEGWPATGSGGASEAPYEIPLIGMTRSGRDTVIADNVDLNGDSIVDRITTPPNPQQVKLGTGRDFVPAGNWNWPTSPGAPRAIRRTESNGNLVSNVFDLDGDGFADLVDSNPVSCAAAAGHWCVWRGSASGFASVPTKWLSPSTDLRITTNGGARVVVDLVDVDADGRLDLVDTRLHDPGVGIHHWNVYRNTGTGFAATATPFAAPRSSLARTTGGRLIYGLFDINADSLPDMVIADGGNPDEQLMWGLYEEWEVHLNDGTGLSVEPVAWPIDGGVGDGVGLPNFLSLSADDGTTIADLFDITGDGRPDLVRRTRNLEPNFTGVSRLCARRSQCLSPDIEESAISRGLCCFNLLVFVNTGSSFSQPVGWSSPAHGLRANFGSCPYDDYCTFSYIYDFDFFDVDGDGLVDFVERYTA